MGLSVFKTAETATNYYLELIAQLYPSQKRHLSLWIEDADLAPLQCKD